MPDVVINHVIEAGSARGLTDLARVNTGSSQTSIVFSGVPSGIYYVRVRAIGLDGVAGPPSNEIELRVGGTCANAPGAPLNFTNTVSGNTVNLFWAAPVVGDAPSSYIVEAGSATGVANVVVFDTGSAATALSAFAPNGVYYARVKARNPCGVSAPSNESTIGVGTPTSTTSIGTTTTIPSTTTIPGPTGPTTSTTIASTTSSSTTSASTTSTTVPGAPDFTLNVSPPLREVFQGGSTTYAVVLQSQNNYAGLVGLSASGLDSVARPGTQFTPQTVTLTANGTATSTFTVATDSGSIPSTNLITFDAKGSVIRSRTSVLVVRPSPELVFAVVLSPTSATVTQGDAVEFDVNLTATHNIGPITYAALNLPQNTALGTGFVPPTVLWTVGEGYIDAGPKLIIRTGTTTQTGTFAVTIEARAPWVGLTAATKLTLTVLQKPALQARGVGRYLRQAPATSQPVFRRAHQPPG